MAAALLLVLAACGGDDSDAPTESPAVTSGPTPTETGPSSTEDPDNGFVLGNVVDLASEQPAMTVFGASPSVIFDIIHSENDTFRHFSLPHYKNAFLLAGALLRELDRRPGRSSASGAAAATR